MSYVHLKTENIKSARKEYYCNVCMHLIEIDTFENLIKEMNDEEINIFTKMKEQDYKILKGQPYIRVTGIFEGSISYSTYAVGMYKIGEKFEIFDL